MNLGLFTKILNLIQRAKTEYSYSTLGSWSLTDVGKFWDSVPAYDFINEKMYPYFRRFTNSFELAQKHLTHHHYQMLDIQARSGKGSLFWYDKKRIKSSVCVDFSDFLISSAQKRLEKSGLKYDSVKITDFPLPFSDQTFDLVCTYETIEHVFDYHLFVKELTRVMTDDGLMILTCPNRAWNWVHSLTAIIGSNHSEGPHRFLKRKELLMCFKENNLILVEENSTILLPFNHRYSIYVDQLLEKKLPHSLKKHLALRRTFILRKNNTQVK